MKKLLLRAISSVLVLLMCAAPVYGSDEPEVSAASDEPAEQEQAVPDSETIPELDGGTSVASPVSIASDKEWGVLLEENRIRVARGLNPLTMESYGQKAADIRVVEIITEWGHYRPDGTYAATALDEVGFTSYTNRCEIIEAGKSFPTPASAVEGWMESQSHKECIIRAHYVHTGIGYTYAAGDTYPNYWEQLLYSHTNCRYTSMSLMKKTVKCDVGADLDDLGIGIEMTCSKHGKVWLPLMEEFCTGYDPKTEGVQTVTVCCLGYTDTLTVIVGDVTGSFDDVYKSDWYYNDVEQCSAKGLVKGTDTREFSPYGYGTRGQVVQVLYRLAGSPQTGSAKSPFSDVTDENKWYYNAVVWASENDIAQGYGDGTFCPEEAVTREQFLSFLYRYACMEGMSGEIPASFSNDYEDAESVSPWALEAEIWSCESGIQKGAADESGKLWLNPQTTIRRSEMAAFFNRFSG